MAHRILIPTPLRPFAGKQDVVEIDGGTASRIRLAQLRDRPAAVRHS